MTTIFVSPTLNRHICLFLILYTLYLFYILCFKSLYLFIISHWSYSNWSTLCRLSYVFIAFYTPLQCSVSYVWSGDHSFHFRWLILVTLSVTLYLDHFFALCMSCFFYRNSNGHSCHIVMASFAFALCYTITTCYTVSHLTTHFSFIIIVRVVNSELYVIGLSNFVLIAHMSASVSIFRSLHLIHSHRSSVSVLAFAFLANWSCILLFTFS